MLIIFYSSLTIRLALLVGLAMSFFRLAQSETDFKLNLKNFKMKLPDISPDLSFVANLTVIKQNEFPYLTVDFNASIDPLPRLFSYESSMRQTRLPGSDNPESYKSHIDILAKSSLFTVLNFNLTQDFYNDDFKTGSEKMTMVIANRLIAEVQGQWNSESLKKRLNLEGLVGSDLDLFTGEWDSRSDTEYNSFALKIKKNFIHYIKGLLFHPDLTASHRATESGIERDEL